MTLVQLVVYPTLLCWLYYVALPWARRRFRALRTAPVLPSRYTSRWDTPMQQINRLHRELGIPELVDSYRPEKYEGPVRPAGDWTRDRSFKVGDLAYDNDAMKTYVSLLPSRGRHPEAYPEYWQLWGYIKQGKGFVLIGVND